MNVKESILALFDDNVVGAISAADMRIFVETIFDYKENEIHVFEELNDVEIYRNTQYSYPILQNDAIIITGKDTNSNWETEKGIYIATKDSPGRTDVTKISADNYNDFISNGEPNQLISLDSNYDLAWINPIEGYYIEGTDTISNILLKRPSQKGEVWIASEDNLSAEVPGFTGDGYSWNGAKWINVGQLRGPEGDVQKVAFANQYEVDSGYIEDKAISPKTFKDSYWLKKKEDSIGSPVEDFYMLTSKQDGTRIWEDPVRNFGDLHDVDTSQATNDSFIFYNGLTWVAKPISNVLVTSFTGLTDTPQDYSGSAHKGLKVNAQQTALEYTDLVTNTRELDDVIDQQPMVGDTLVYYYDGMKYYWRPQAKTQAGTLSNRPINPAIGTPYFDTSLGLPIWFNGTNWVDANGQQK